MNSLINAFEIPYHFRWTSKGVSGKKPKGMAKEKQRKQIAISTINTVSPSNPLNFPLSSLAHPTPKVLQFMCSPVITESTSPPPFCSVADLVSLLFLASCYFFGGKFLYPYTYTYKFLYSYAYTDINFK